MKLSFSRKCDKINPSISCLGGTKMAICYDRLFHLMIDKKISNAQLKEKAGFSANIITRLKRNEYVSIESIERICRVMECGVDDILEFVPEESKEEKV
jgi:putative transcriptional regulator